MSLTFRTVGGDMLRNVLAFPTAVKLNTIPSSLTSNCYLHGTGHSQSAQFETWCFKFRMNRYLQKSVTLSLNCFNFNKSNEVLLDQQQ